MRLVACGAVELAAKFFPRTWQSSLPARPSLAAAPALVVFLLTGTVESGGRFGALLLFRSTSVLIVHATIASLSAWLPLRFSTLTFGS